MSGFGAIGEFPISGPPQPISGTWASTETTDTFAAVGSLLGGVWASVEGITAGVIDITEFFDVNGGHIELKLTTVAGLVNGSTITVRGVTLEPLANGTWTISLSFGNFVDLIGSPPPNNQGTTSAGTASWGEDLFNATGSLIGGKWESIEAKDLFNAIGSLIGGKWTSVEAKDTFTAVIELSEVKYDETIQIFGILLAAQALANNGDSTPHNLLPVREK